MSLPGFALKPGRMVDVGGYRLNLYCFGKGSPTVILEAGGGWGAVAWAGIQQRLARATRVCSYDRAGMNFSDVGPIDSPLDAEAQDLWRLTQAAKLAPPFLLVGWSAGGMIARTFAYAHQDATAGIVTLDGSTFDYAPADAQQSWRPRAIDLFRRCRDAAMQGAFDSDPDLLEKCTGLIIPLHFVPGLRTVLGSRAREPGRYATILHHLEQGPAADDALRAQRRPLADMPLRIVVAGSHVAQDGTRDGEIADASFIRHAYEVASLSSDGAVILLPATTHGIHLDRPGAVVSIIEETIRRVRARTGHEASAER